MKERSRSIMVQIQFLMLVLSVCVLLTACGAGGLFTQQKVTLPPFNNYTSGAVADLNGDGKLDIVVCYALIAGPPPHPGTVAVFLQDPANPGHFAAPVTYAVGNDPSDVVIADLNGDGRPDIIAVSTILNYTGAGSSNISVLLQGANTPGKFLAATNYPTGSNPTIVAVGDLDGDGKLDLAVSDSTGISILLQDPNAPGTFLPKTTIGVPGGTSSVAIGDLNLDGRQDLVATSSNGVLVYLQDPAVPGRFLLPSSYPAGQQPLFVAIGDLNADGKPDLAVADMGSPNGGTTTGVHVLFQSPMSPGTFQAAQDYGTASPSWMVAIGDLNNDGMADLALASLGNVSNISGNVSVMLQDHASPGTFQPVVHYPGSSLVLWITPADIDGDGKTDLVIVDGGVQIRLQDPANPGTFLAPTVITK